MLRDGSTHAWGGSALSQGWTCLAGTDTSIDSQLTYESPFGDLDIIPIPACATREGNQPTYHDIRKMPPNKRKKWEDAIENEITGLFQSGCVNDRHVLEDSLPSWSPSLKKASEVINGLWVLLRKKGADGEINRYKSRCVANDCKARRVHRIPLLETFSPSARHSSLKCQLWPPHASRRPRLGGAVGTLSSTSRRPTSRASPPTWSSVFFAYHMGRGPVTNAEWNTFGDSCLLSMARATPAASGIAP